VNGFVDVGGRVQVVLRMAADERVVLGEGHVALDDAGAHPGRGDVRLGGVLGELQGGTAMADGEVARGESAATRALLQRLPERAFAQVVDEEERARPELHGGGPLGGGDPGRERDAVVAGPGSGIERRRTDGDGDRDEQCAHGSP
jgi:hypothetical protein